MNEDVLKFCIRALTATYKNFSTALQKVKRLVSGKVQKFNDFLRCANSAPLNNHVIITQSVY